MSHFLDNYEDVNSRIKRFREKYPENRIETEAVLFQPENGWVLFKCSIWKNSTGQTEERPDAVDYAFGDRETYPANMKKWYVEDTATSSVGRCIALLIDVDHKSTKQNMARVEKVLVPNVEEVWTTVEKPAPQKMDTAAIASQLEAEVVPECKHGAMRLKEGTKNNRAYHGYICPASGSITDVCEPKWYDLSPSGKWVYKPKKG